MTRGDDFVGQCAAIRTITKTLGFLYELRCAHQHPSHNLPAHPQPFPTPLLHKVQYPNSPMALLREIRILDASEIIEKTVELVKACPDELYDLLVRHPYDAGVYESIFPTESW